MQAIKKCNALIYILTVYFSVIGMCIQSLPFYVLMTFMMIYLD